MKVVVHWTERVREILSLELGQVLYRRFGLRTNLLCHYTVSPRALVSYMSSERNCSTDWSLLVVADRCCVIVWTYIRQLLTNAVLKNYTGQKNAVMRLVQTRIIIFVILPDSLLRRLECYL